MKISRASGSSQKIATPTGRIVSPDQEPMNATNIADIHGVCRHPGGGFAKYERTVTMSDVGSGPKTAKSKRTFHPLRLLRRLSNAESEFGLRLSSGGTQQKVEAGNSEAWWRPSPLSEPSTSRPIHRQ